jgi:3-methyladenine DNA glycosylase Tag
MGMAASKIDPATKNANRSLALKVADSSLKVLLYSIKNHHSNHLSIPRKNRHSLVNQSHQSSTRAFGYQHHQT